MHANQTSAGKLGLICALALLACLLPVPPNRAAAAYMSTAELVMKPVASRAVPRVSIPCSVVLTSSGYGTGEPTNTGRSCCIASI